MASNGVAARRPSNGVQPQTNRIHSAVRWAGRLASWAHRGGRPRYLASAAPRGPRPDLVAEVVMHTYRQGDWRLHFRCVLDAVVSPFVAARVMAAAIKHRKLAALYLAQH